MENNVKILNLLKRLMFEVIYRSYWIKQLQDVIIDYKVKRIKLSLCRTGIKKNKKYLNF